MCVSVCMCVCGQASTAVELGKRSEAAALEVQAGLELKLSALQKASRQLQNQNDTLAFKVTYLHGHLLP